MELNPETMRLTPEQKRRMPPVRYKGSPARIILTNQEIQARVYWRFLYSIRGVKGLYRKKELDHPVKLALDQLTREGLIVPNVFYDKPLYLRCLPGERYIYNTKGEIIYDKEMRKAMHKAKGFTGKIPHGMKNPEWGTYPKIEPAFDPFPKGHVVQQHEKFERVMKFLELYADTGHIMAAGKAVGSTFYQLLIWANEDPVLMEQVAIAEATVRMSVRSIATHMAYQGNEKMISLLMKEETERRKAVKDKGGTQLEVSDEVTEVIAITQRAAALVAARELNETESIEETFVDEIQTVEIDSGYRPESN